MAVFFNGRLITTPSVVSRVDDTRMANTNLTVPMNLAIIGRADSGEPKKVYVFQNPVEARETLQGGELLTAVERAFSPSAMTYGPATVRAVRVDPAVQARLCIPQNGASEVTGSLQDNAAHATPTITCKLASGASAVDGYYVGQMIKITSGAAQGETNLIEGYTGSTKICTLKYPWKNTPAASAGYSLKACSFVLESTDYGDNANRIRAKIQAGTNPGTLKVTTAYAQSTYVQDNLDATYFTLLYDGEEASCLVDITASQMIIKAGDLGSEGTIQTIDLSVYNTVDKLVDYLDNLADFTATATAAYRDAVVYRKLDFVTAKAISASTATEITADLQAVIDWIDSFGEPFIQTFRPTTSGVIPVVFDYTFLMGGNTGVAVTTDWQSCFDGLQSEDVQIVVALSSVDSIHVMLDTHCDYMSNQGQMERRGISGGALGETVAQHIARAALMNSDRFYLCAPGIKDFDSTGEITTYPPYIFAALVGGMACGVDPGTPLTFKTLRIRGLEQTFRNPSDTDQLINGGVLGAMSTKQGFRIVKSVSTWLVNRNYNRVELSTGIAVDFVSRNVRETLLEMIGKKARPVALREAISRVESTLKELAREEPMGPEVIVGDDENPAFKNITATIEGDVLRVYFECSPVIPINYVPVAIACQVWTGSASATQQ